MTDLSIPFILAFQTTLVGLGLMVLPWGGKRLDDATRSVQKFNARLRKLAARVTRDGPTPSTHRRRSDPSLRAVRTAIA